MLAGESTVSGDVATTTTTTNTNTTVTATPTAAPAGRESHNEGGDAATAGGCNSGEDNKSRVLDDADRAFGGNRWPRQETLTLLKIRSDMDVAFRDASVKGPLWEEVSRKLGELGYNRSAKKCKEKFENVYKYHKRTREGRTGKGQGKTYRFFDQLEAFENHPSLSSPSPKPQAPAAGMVAPVSVAMLAANPPHNINTVPSTTHIATENIVTIPATNLTTIPSYPSANPTNLRPQQAANPTNFPSQTNNPSSFPNIPADLLSNSTSSATSSDLELEGRRKRKRKWRDFFERLIKEVIGKQEELQKKFLEAIEKREHERMVSEEAWRMQEMIRINREREILAQERSISAAKDEAVMAFLQKLAEQQNPGQIQGNNIIIPPPIISPTPPPAPPPSQSPSHPLPSPPASAPQPQPAVSLHIVNLGKVKTDNGNQTTSFTPTSSSRWPKVEVQALIKLRTNLDSKYQENGPKGLLWEEISAGMRKLGYNRNAKRCKEKWENINKYFKKVKENSKKRPYDSKTCPYFHQLDALYKEKNKFDHRTSNQLFKPENSVPLMVRPEQQWPPQPEHRMLQQDSAMEDVESDQNVEEDDNDVEEQEEDDGVDLKLCQTNRLITSMQRSES